MQRSAVKVGVLLLLSGLLGLGPGVHLPVGAAPATLSFPPGQWSMLMNGPMHRGRSPFQGPQNNHLAWFIDTQTNYGGAAIGRDGTIYQGTSFHQLLAISPDGVIKWAILAGRSVGATPAIMPDGRIVFVDEAGTIYAANPDGTLSWTLATGDGTNGNISAPAITRDGTIYLTAGPIVYALNPDGTTRWIYDLGISNALGAVAVRPDGVVYVGSAQLYAIDPTGSLLWSTERLFATGLSIGPDGTIYASSLFPEVYAFRPDGTVKWTYEADTCCDVDEAAVPAIGPDGTIYVGRYLGGQGAMLALNPDGTLKWRSDHGLSPTSPVIDGDGTIYFGGGSGGPGSSSVFALNPDGSLKWQFDTPDGYLRTPIAIGARHRLYAGTSRGIYAIGPG